MAEKPAAGILYIVATPIGNPADITRRAVDILNFVDAVICEERKNGARLLKELGLSKTLIELNEHNESSLIQEILVLLMQGQSLALISDCGTPVFSDPGRQLLVLLEEMNIQVVPVPGASSLMAAVSVCPFNLEQFQFVGFPQKQSSALPACQTPGGSSAGFWEKTARFFGLRSDSSFREALSRNYRRCHQANEQPQGGVHFDS
jgi:16S rRNA (cytidine1402-2'-O)-methyltransferase